MSVFFTAESQVGPPCSEVGDGYRERDCSRDSGGAGWPWSLQRWKDGQLHRGAGRCGVGRVKLRLQGPAGQPLLLITNPSPGGQGTFRRLSPSPVACRAPSSVQSRPFAFSVSCFML